jgi:hypothetical protein
MTSYRKPSTKGDQYIEVGGHRIKVDEVPDLPLSAFVGFPTQGTVHHRHIQSPLNMTSAEQENYSIEDYREWKKDAERVAKARGVSISQL